MSESDVNADDDQEITQRMGKIWNDQELTLFDKTRCGGWISSDVWVDLGEGDDE